MSSKQVELSDQVYVAGCQVRDDRTFARHPWRNSITQRLTTTTPITQGRPKLAVFGRPGTTHFLTPALRSLADSYEIYRYYAVSPGVLKDLASVDLVWIEWGGHAYFLQYIKSLFPNLPVIVRLHDWEIGSEVHGAKPPYDLADLLIFVNSEAMQDFRSIIPQIPEAKQILIPNSVDESQFPLINRDSGYGKTLVLSSLRFQARKRIDRAIEILKLVVDEDSEFKLLIRANYKDVDAQSWSLIRRRIEKYDLWDHVVFAMARDFEMEGLARKDDIRSIYAAGDIILSTSDHEAFHYSVAEGMLSGLYPVVLNWEWGQPKELWGDYVVPDIGAAAERILDWAKKTVSEKEELSFQSREYVSNRFGLSTTRKQLIQVLDKLHVPPGSPRRPRAIFFAHHHLDRWNPHGGEKSTKSVIQHMQHKGWDVLVLVRNVKNDTFLRETVDGIDYLVVPTGDDFTTACGEVIDWWQPDIALTWDSPAVDVSPICDGRSLPLVLFIRFWHLINKPPYDSLLTDPIDEDHRRQHQEILDRAALVVTNAKHVSQVVERVYQRESMVSYVPVKRLPKLEETGEDAYVTIVNLAKGGAEVLVRQLAELLPDIRFLVIDGKPVEGMPSNVTIRPYTNDPYNQTFRNSSILLFPSDYDGCGTGRVVYEAQFLGVPVITPARGGLPEVVPPETLVSPNASTQEWADRIREVLSEYEAHSASAQDAVRDYDANIELDKVTDALDDVLNSWSPSSLIETSRPVENSGLDRYSVGRLSKADNRWVIRGSSLTKKSVIGDGGGVTKLAGAICQLRPKGDGARFVIGGRGQTPFKVPKDSKTLSAYFTLESEEETVCQLLLVQYPSAKLRKVPLRVERVSTTLKPGVPHLRRVRAKVHPLAKVFTLAISVQKKSRPIKLIDINVFHGQLDVEGESAQLVGSALFKSRYGLSPGPQG